MTSVIWEGRPRTGKTLGMVIYAYANHLKGYETYTNFKCSFADKRVKDIYDVLDIVFSDVERSPKQILLQEIDKWFDSWLKGEEMRLVSSFAGQSGKRNLEILGDTQYWTRVQKSLRKVFEYGVVCSAYVDRQNKPIAFEQMPCEINGREEFEPMISKPLIFPVTMPMNGLKIEDYYHLYDSYEPTTPFIKEKGE